MSVIQNIEVSVSEVLICELELYIGMRLRTLMFLVFWESSIQGFLLYNIPWVWLNCPLSGGF